MIFLLDNNILSIIIKEMPIESFYGYIYEPLEELINNNQVFSIDEVYRELENGFGKSNQKFSWIIKNKKMFLQLNNQDCGNLKRIFSSKKFQESVKEASILKGSPEADAMLVAKAITLNAIVVTNESNNKPNAEKVPNICVQFNVRYIKRDCFYKVLRNKAEGRELLSGVKVLTSLENE